MRYLAVFLDIDGVLNRCERLLSFTLDDECLKNFAEFIHNMERTHRVRIYLSSSWRRGLDPSLDREKSSPQMKELLDKFEENHIKLSGYTPISNRPVMEVRRDDEIRHMLKRLGTMNVDVITIDDDEELYSDNRDGINLYLTNYKEGFRKEDVKKAMKAVRAVDISLL